MKALLVSLVVGALAAGAYAGDSEKGPRTLVVRKTKPVAVTGTNIASPVKRIGNTYDTVQSIHVIDRRRIEQSGASNVAQLLRSYPGARIR